VAIVGSGNIGTDLLMKLRRSDVLEPVALVGIDPASEGLRRAQSLGVATSAEGLDWILDRRDRFTLVFDATSASAHRAHAPRLRQAGLVAVDLTPAAVGPGVVPPVNIAEHLDRPNVSLITCGGQATIPVVAAVSAVAPVPYAEIVSTISSKSAGPGTRQNIDEFTRATAAGLEAIGGARTGKAIIVLNPAEPPILMRNTVYCALADDADAAQAADAVATMVGAVARYVPGYRLVGEPIVEDGPFATPGGVVGRRLTVLLEVRGAGDFLPPYAGNLDIMTSAARRAGEALVGAGIAA
jgi:acetaldehyde dehydrogenase